MSSPNQLLTASQVARALKDTYWVNKAQGTVYNTYLWSEYATPNTIVPFSLTIKVYTPTSDFYADSRQYRGWIKLDGSVLMSDSTDGYQGQLRGDDTIVWQDGQVWQKTTIKPSTTIDQYSAEGNLMQAASMTNWFDQKFQASYPRYTRFFPYGNTYP